MENLNQKYKSEVGIAYQAIKDIFGKSINELEDDFIESLP